MVKLNASRKNYIRESKMSMNELHKYGISSYYELDKLDESQIVSVIKNYCPYAIKYLTNPSYRVQEVSITQNAGYLRFIKNPSDKIIRLALKQDIQSAIYIKKPSADMQIFAVSLDPIAVKYLGPTCKRAQILAVSNKPDMYTNIKNPELETSILAVTYDKHMLPYVPIEHQQDDAFRLMLKLEHDFDVDEPIDLDEYLEDDIPF